MCEGGEEKNFQFFSSPPSHMCNPFTFDDIACTISIKYRSAKYKKRERREIEGFQ
jgi:hypothetical protein